MFEKQLAKANLIAIRMMEVVPPSRQGHISNLIVRSASAAFAWQSLELLRDDCGDLCNEYESVNPMFTVQRCRSHEASSNPKSWEPIASGVSASEAFATMTVPSASGDQYRAIREFDHEEFTAQELGVVYQ